MPHVDDCRKFVKYLSDHFDGVLEVELETEFMLHCKYCERARALVRTFERTIILHKQTGGGDLPADVHKRLLEAIRSCEDCDE